MDIVTALGLFAVGVIALEAGMGRAKGATHCFIKGFVAIGVGLFIGIGLPFEEALVGAVAALLATVGLGDRVTLSAAFVLAGGVALLHRFLTGFDSLVSLLSSVPLPEGVAALGPIGDWLTMGWGSDYGGLWTVHALAGGAALGALRAVRPRLGRYLRDGASAALPGHNLPLAGLGAGLIWVGMKGFAPALWSGISYTAFTSFLAALAFTKWRFGKFDPSFALTAFWAGLIAGLAVVTQTPLWNLFVGSLGGTLAILFSLWLDRRFVDDPIGVVAAEGLMPLFGTLVRWFIEPQIFGMGWLGWLGAFALGFLVTHFLGQLLWWIGILRPSPTEELTGLDQSLYGIPAYSEFELRET